MHNNIMAAGSKDRPPMLGPGRYSQWRSRFLRYIDTKINGEGLKKCILNGPYVPTSVLIQAVPAAEGRPAVQQHTTIETVLNMTLENKEHFQSEKEAIFLLLTGIGDEIYSTVDACNTANEMWIAIERLQQGESLNVQDVKTNLFWEFGKFTSRDGESMESYYSRFYKLMNELTRNNLEVTIMQVSYIKTQLVQSSVTSSGDETSSGIVSDEEIDKQELEAHYGFMAKIQEVLPAESSSTDTPLEQIPYDTSDPANRFAPDREETMTLDNESRSKLDKETVKPYDYTRQIVVMKFSKHLN
ncbi:hypothetical protein Tco_1334973 [Tanacetum coccineum]